MASAVEAFAVATHPYPLASAVVATATTDVATDRGAGCNHLSFNHCCHTDCCKASCSCCSAGFRRGSGSYPSYHRDHRASHHVHDAGISDHRACSDYHHFDSYPEFDPCYDSHHAFLVDRSNIGVGFISLLRLSVRSRNWRVYLWLHLIFRPWPARSQLLEVWFSRRRVPLLHRKIELPFVLL